MSRANDNTYPVDSLALTPNGTVQMGLTIREHFAITCLQGLLACPEVTGTKETIVRIAVDYADALIAELAK